MNKGFYQLLESSIVLILLIATITLLSESNYKQDNKIILNKLKLDDFILILSKENSTDSEHITKIIEFLFEDDKDNVSIFIDGKKIYGNEKENCISSVKHIATNDFVLKLSEFKLLYCE